ncbi:MAG: hypothetical protein GF315_13945 [candidate division Zixibacteria bacterium]|nr:hypothetical protein [candidate division Zixibacteria bacterium]
MRYSLRIPIIFIFTILITGAFMSSNASAEVPDPDTIQAVAVYEASVNTSDELPDSLVNYNVVSPSTIADMFNGIEADTLRDCSGLDAKNNAYIYAKFDNGERQVYHLFLRWSHFSLKGVRGNCYYVSPDAQTLFKDNAQQ